MMHFVSQHVTLLCSMWPVVPCRLINMKLWHHSSSVQTGSCKMMTSSSEQRPLAGNCFLWCHHYCWWCKQFVRKRKKMKKGVCTSCPVPSVIGCRDVLIYWLLICAVCSLLCDLHVGGKKNKFNSKSVKKVRKLYWQNVVMCQIWCFISFDLKWKKNKSLVHFHF